MIRLSSKDIVDPEGTGETVFARDELEKIIVELEKVSPGRDSSLRPFIDGRVSYLQSLIAAWDK